jgi:cell wall-associated NlpC family hydrolase
VNSRRPSVSRWSSERLSRVAKSERRSLISGAKRTLAERLPERFQTVRYVYDRYPGVPGLRGVEDGANCQVFAYEVLRHFGYEVPDVRSSELWEDTSTTVPVEVIEPLDLLLFNSTEESFGAHVGVYLGSGKILHLCKELGHPAVWAWEDFASRPHYQVLVGAKRCVARTAAPVDLSSKQ